MKKMLKVFGIIAVAVCLIVSVVACDSSAKDSVSVVAVSENEYASAEDALKGYVKEELAYTMKYTDGEDVEFIRAQYVSNESKGEVAKKKIKLSDDQKTNLESVEKFAVKAKIAMISNKGEEKYKNETTQTVYVLKYGEKYKFMVSDPELGERVTNSYVKMLTDDSKYENCTITGVGADKEEDEEKPKFNTALEFKLTAEASYNVKYYNETRYNNRAPSKDEESCDRVSYVLFNGGDIVDVNKTYNGEDKVEWIATDNSDEDISTVKDYNKNIVQGNIFGVFFNTPAALYTKTENGFEFKIEEIDSDGDKEVYGYRITVSDDKIIGVYMIEQLIWSDGEKEYVESFDTTITLSAFGSTTVTVPSEVTAALNK